MFFLLVFQMLASSVLAHSSASPRMLRISPAAASKVIRLIGQNPVAVPKVK